jgi:hypothetical protein
MLSLILLHRGGSKPRSRDDLVVVRNTTRQARLPRSTLLVEIPGELFPAGDDPCQSHAVRRSKTRAPEPADKHRRPTPKLQKGETYNYPRPIYRGGPAFPHPVFPASEAAGGGGEGSRQTSNDSQSLSRERWRGESVSV